MLVPHQMFCCVNINLQRIRKCKMSLGNDTFSITNVRKRTALAGEVGHRRPATPIFTISLFALSLLV